MAMEEKIIDLIIEAKGDTSLKDSLTNNSNIIEDVGLDSLQMINLMLRIEDEFGVEIDFDEFDFTHLNSINAFSKYLSNRVVS
jgi:acyl carrier protein